MILAFKWAFAGAASKRRRRRRASDWTFSAGLLALGCLVLTAGGCTKQIRKQRLISQANRDFEAGKYDTAEGEYVRAIQINKNDPVANRQLGILYSNEGNDIQALGYLRKALELTPDNPDAQLKYGMLYLTHGGYKEAAAAARKVLAIQPGTEDALLLLVDTARTTAEAEDVRQSIEKLRLRDHDRAGYHLALGSLRLGHRDTAGAEEEFKQALALDPKSGAANLDLGNLALLVHRDPKQAEVYFRTAADLSPVRSSRRLRYIEFLSQVGRTPDAKKALAEIIREAPDYLPAWVFVMKAAFLEKRYDDCAAAVQRILERNPVNYDALLQRGILKRTQGDIAGSIVDLRHAESIYRRNLQLEYQLALTYVQKGDLAIARNLLNEALTFAPRYEPAIFMLAEIDLRSGDAAGAVSLLGDYMKGPRPSDRAFILQAHAYEAARQLDQALEVYRRMATAFPRDPQPLYFAATVLLRQKQPAQARQLLEKALALAPNYGAAAERLLDLDIAEKHLDAAEARVRSWTKQFPNAAAPFMFQAKIDLARRDLPAAEADLNRAIEQEPKRQDAYLALVDLYMASNQAQPAIDSLTALTTHAPNVTALMEIGMIQHRLKHYDAEVAAYQKVVALDPKYMPAQNNLAYLYAEQMGKLDLGYDLAKRARALTPDDANSADTLGWILFRMGNYRDALPLLQESAEKVPGSGVMQYHLGMVHYMLGEEDLARVALQAAVATTTAFAGREDADQRLGILAIDAGTATAAMRADLEKRVQAAPDDTMARVRLAEIQRSRGEAAPAAANFEAALKRNPRNPRILMELSELDGGLLKRPDQALELAQSAHELRPNDPAIAQTLGHQLYLAGEYDRSMSLLQGATQGAVDAPELLYDLARDYYAVGRLDDAEATLARVLPSAAPFSRRAEADDFAAMLAAGKSPALAQAAVARARQILAAHPGDLPAQMISSLAAEQRGEYPLARQIDEKILADNQLFSPAIRRLALLYAEKLGDDGKAYDLAVKARETYPDDAELAGVLGMLDYRRADYVGAAHLFQESLAKRPDTPEMAYYLGMCHYQMKEGSVAKTELQHALDLNLSGQEAEEARRALDELKGDFHGPSLSAQPIN
jgi:tetratricopeptide (TPR) repeat protein